MNNLSTSPPQNKSTQPYPDPVQSFTASFAALEYHVTASVLSNIGPGVAISHAEGLEGWMIESDDLRTIFIAAETTADLDNRSATLCLAKRGLMHFGHWDGLGWHDERLLALAMEYWNRPPVTRECAAAIVQLHNAWADAAEEFGPMYLPPPALGQLNAVRTGLILAKLSRLAGLPVEWLHYRFAQHCWRMDGRITFEESARTRPIIINAPDERAKGAA